MDMAHVSVRPEEGAWYDEETADDADVESVDQYDLTVTPNDFNTKTIYDFIESGAVYIPGFQRNYVWDLKRASKLIESLIIGLPVPQVFLYEEGRNRFLVIDGQQRLMSMYYFIKQRFPVMEKRSELREIFEKEGRIPDEIFHNDAYFQKFGLRLPRRLDGQSNRFSELNYQTLGDYKTTFDLRPIRNIIVKQVSPSGDDSAMYEIFNRLNTGGVNLTPQEIRSSLYHSKFYSMLFRLNMQPKWRRLLGIQEPDIHVKDVEFLLRGFALLIDSEAYNPSMSKFLNSFSKKAKHFEDSYVAYCESLFRSFLDACDSLDERALKTQTNRFSVTVFEAVFYAAASDAFQARAEIQGRIDPASVSRLRSDPKFTLAANRGTTNSSNVDSRLRIAKELVSTAE